MNKEYQILSCDEELSYRYRLDVSTLIKNSNRLAIVQLNPSTANGTKADPTIGKVSYWARENGIGRVTFLNLFAIRTAYPNELIGKTYETLVGSRNNDVSQLVFSSADTIVFAWGKISAAMTSHYSQRLNFLKQLLGNRKIHAVGELVAGEFPRHGRMWNGDNRTLREFVWCD